MAKDDTHYSGFPTRPYEFDDLKLVAGNRFQLEVEGRPEMMPARLLGYLRGESLMVKPPASEFAGPNALSEGMELVVRGFSGRIAFSFRTMIVKVRFSPYPYCHLLFPTEIYGAEIRHSERVRVNLSTRVTCYPQGKAEEIPDEAVMVNISIAGALLVSQQPLGEIGDRVSLAFRFWVLPNAYEVNMQVSALIQAVTQVSHEEYHVGVRFEEMRSSEAILLQNLIYQRLQEGPDASV